MQIRKPTKLASHDLLVLLVIAVWTFVVLLFSAAPRDGSFLSVVEITRAFYPIVDELAICFGPSSHAVYSHILWLPIAPIFFLIVNRSRSVRKAIAEHNPSWPRIFAATALLAVFFFCYPPDISCTRNGSRAASVLFSGRFTSTVIAGLITYLMAGISAYVSLIIRSMIREVFGNPASRM